MSTATDSHIITWNDAISLVSLGTLEWSGSAHGASDECLTRTDYNTWVRNDGALGNSNRLITFGLSKTHAVTGGGGGPSPIHTLSLSWPGTAQTGEFSTNLPGAADTNQYSYEFWIKRVGSGIKQTIISRQHNVDNKGWSFGIGSDNHFKFWVLNTDGSVTEHNFGLPSTTGWMHVSIQVNVTSSASTQQLRLNGSSQGATVFAAAVPEAPGGSQFATIAHVPNVTALDDYNGLIDDIRVYNTFRSGAAIDADKTSDTPGTGIVYRWRLESYTGSKVFASDTGSPAINFTSNNASDSTEVPF